MTDTIVINFIDAELPIHWAKFGEGVQQEVGVSASLDELAEHAQQHQLIAWVPSDKVSFTTASIPSGQQRHVDKVLPSILEDDLATDIDQLHFVTGAIANDEQLNVAIIEREQMVDWLEQFNNAGIKPHALLPNSLAIPLHDEQWSLYVDGDLSQLRTSPQIGHLFDTQNIATVFQLLSADSNASLSVYAPENQQSRLNIPLQLEWRGQTIDKLALMPDKAVMQMSLLQGDFKPQSNVQKYWKQWKAVAILAVVALGLQLATVGIETWQLNQQVKHTKVEIEKVFHKTFPDEKRLVNAKAQTIQRLARLESQQDRMGYLMLLQQLSPALKTSSNVSLSRINFERRLGTINLDVKAQDYAQLEQLKVAINKLGMNAELGSVSGNKGAYTARLMIRGTR
ncbi:MAG: type II secretion system protein GspL [Methylophaga sp.]|nr:type II secretion system protein GspL [Methylophaga sp.]